MDDFKDFGSPLLNDPVLGGLELNEFLDEYSATDFNFDVDTMFDQLPENKPMIPAEDHDYDLPHGSPGSDRSGPSTSGSSCSASTIDSGYTSSPNSKNLFFDILDAASNEISEFKGEPKEEPEDVPSSPTDGYSSANRQYIFANCNNGSRPNGATATTTRRYVTGGNSAHPRAPIRTTVRFKPAPRHALSSGGNTVRSTAGNAERYQQNAASTEFTSAAGGNAQRKYPALILTEEEKRLCKKEGIVLPEHYPLTKSEERELKRIRRKIRNKKSAQTSRRRKQDYIEALEDRVDHCTQENCELKRQIELLSRENQNILAQLRKVQASLSNSTKRSTQAGTCLAVLLLSVCLLVAPNLSPLSQSNQVGQNDSMEDVATADNNAAVAAAMADAQAQLHAVHMHNTYEEFQQQHEEMSNHEHYYNFKQSPFVGKSRTLMDFVHPNRQDICAEKIAIVDSPHKEHHYVEEESIAEIYAVNKNEQRAPKQRQPYSYKRQYVNDQQPIIIESGKVMAPLVVDGANLMPRQPAHPQAVDTPIRLVPARLVNATEGFNGMEPQRKRYRY